jgi:hypothetical protein
VYTVQLEPYNIRPIIFKPNDVRTSVACDVSHIPRMYVNPPALFVSEIAGDKLRRSKSAISSVLRYVDAVFAESRDVPESITIEVYDNTPMLLDVPLLGSESVEHKFRWFYDAITLVDRNIDPVVTEADNINTRFARHVGESPNMLVDAPTAREGELVEALDNLGIFECPVAIVFRNDDAGLPKSNDVRETFSVEIAQEVGMLVDPPSLIITEVTNNNGRWSESVTLVLGQEDASVTKSNDISTTSLPNINHVADVFIDAPTRAVREILKLRLKAFSLLFRVAMRTFVSVNATRS